MSRGFENGVSALQAQAARREVTIGGKRIRVIDIHCHCVIDVSDIVKGTPLEKQTGGGGNQVLGPQRLQLMDKTEIRKQTGKSPDFADAACYACADLGYDPTSDASKLRVGDEYDMGIDDILDAWEMQISPL